MDLTCSENSYISYKLPAFYPIFSFFPPINLLQCSHLTLPVSPSLSMSSFFRLTYLEEAVLVFYFMQLGAEPLFTSPVFIISMPPYAPVLLAGALPHPSKMD